MNSQEKGEIGEKLVHNIISDAYLEYFCFLNPKDENGNQKEICDSLIIFNDILIIISVKNYKFKNSYDRYFNNTIKKAEKQLIGAERKLFNKEDIYIKHHLREKERFDQEKIKKVYRIIVNLGKGPKFYNFSNTFKDKFINIFDKESFESIINELDTISDLTDYLDKKEQYFKNKNTIILPSEEFDFSLNDHEQYLKYFHDNFKNDKQAVNISGTELDFLAHYIENNKNFSNDLNKNDINIYSLLIDGKWQDFLSKREVKIDRKLKQYSYYIDNLIKNKTDNMAAFNNNLDSISILMSFNRLERTLLSEKLHTFYNLHNKNLTRNYFARSFGIFNKVGVIITYSSKDLSEYETEGLSRIAADSFILYSNFKIKNAIIISLSNNRDKFKTLTIKNIKKFNQSKIDEIKKYEKQLGWFTKHKQDHTRAFYYPEKTN